MALSRLYCIGPSLSQAANYLHFQAILDQTYYKTVKFNILYLELHVQRDLVRRTFHAESAFQVQKTQHQARVRRSRKMSIFDIIFVG